MAIIRERLESMSLDELYAAANEHSITLRHNLAMADGIHKRIQDSSDRFMVLVERIKVLHDQEHESKGKGKGGGKIWDAYWGGYWVSDGGKGDGKGGKGPYGSTGLPFTVIQKPKAPAARMPASVVQKPKGSAARVPAPVTGNPSSSVFSHMGD